MELYTTAQVAQTLQVTRQCLTNWRHREVGPPYIKIAGSTVRYPADALTQWLDAQPTGGVASSSSAALTEVAPERSASAKRVRRRER